MDHPKESSSIRNHNPRFFKFLFPDPFTNQLRIPENFYKHLPAVPPKQASLVIQSGKFWRVDVCQNEQGIYFGRGWPEFAKALDLCLGYFLVFQYEGKMVFNVEVFDTTCCLKDHPSTPRKPTTFKFEPSEFVDLTTDVNSEGDTQVPIASGKRRIDASDKAQLTGKEHSEEAVQILKSKVQEEKIQKSSPHMCTVPQFEKTLNRSSTTKYRRLLIIPKRFCMENGLVSERTMFLKNSEGKKWRVKFSVRHTGELSTGWRDFSTENGLNEKDKCIFQLINKNTFLVHVVGKY